VSLFPASGEGPSSPVQTREARPNPRWPQEGQVEARVSRVRAVIARNPHELTDIRSPVTAVVDDGRLGMYFVEGVLSDADSRFMLNGVGLHCVSKARQRGGKP
jgi:hypothetical protein